MNGPGFMVWSPEGRMPSYVHPTFKGALAEAERLKRNYPSRRFYVMSPVDGLAGAQAATSFEQGKAEGHAAARREIMQAEAAHDRLADRLRDLRAELAALKDRTRHVLSDVQGFQSIVADCVTWFAGFEAAFQHKESWERPWTPDRDKLRALNSALQSAIPSTANDLSDDDIPF